MAKRLMKKSRPAGMKKRLLSLAMALALMVGMVPATALAAGESSSQQIDSYGGITYYKGEGDSQTAVNQEDAYDVSVSKTIAGTGTENQFEITLEVTTTQKLDELKVSADAAVVLVMDVSNSMKETLSGVDTSDTSKMRITMAKTAAKDFLTKYADVEGDATRMISVVEFGASAKTVYDWQNITAEGGLTAAQGAVDNVEINFNQGGHLCGDPGAHRIEVDKDDCSWVRVGYIGKNQWKCLDCGQTFKDKKDHEHACDGTEYVDGEKDSGATNIDAGLRLAYNLVNELKGQAAYQDIQNYHVILLSDGSPTQHSRTSNATASTSFIAKETGGGSITWKSDYDYAVSSAAAVRSVATLHTIAYASSRVGMSVYPDGTNDYVGSGPDRNSLQGYPSKLTDFLKNKIASSTNTAYTADDLESLLNTFEAINQSIASLAQAWTVTDPMAANIKLNVDSLGNRYSDPDGCISVTEDDNGLQTIHWNVLEDQVAGTNGSGSTKYFVYRLNYTITLNNLETGTDTVPTNGTTTLTYILTDDPNGEIPAGKDPSTATFQIPEVHGLTGGFEFTKTDKNNDAAQFGYQTQSGSELQNVATFTLTHSSDCGCGGTYTTQASTVNNKVEFANIPSGHTYTMTETVPAGYDQSKAQTYTVTVAWGKVTVQDASSSVVYTENKAMTVENELDPQEKTLTVTKTWLGGEPAANTTVTVNVTGTNESGEEAFTGTLTISKQSDGTWSGTLTVPTVDVNNGETITYSIAEQAVSGWKQVNTGGSGLALTLTNARSENVTYSVEKKWVGPEADKKEVVARLMNGDTVVDTVTLNSTNSWKGTFKTVDAYNNSGNPITYTVKEFIDGNEVTNTVTVNGHSYNAKVDLSDDTYVIYNTVAQDNTATATGIKTWNTSAITGATATFELLADDQATGKTVTLNQGESTISFSSLPKYALPGTVVGNVTYGDTADGHEIVYTFQETATTGAPTGDSIRSSSSNNKDFTNTLTGTTSVTVTKVWEDNLDAEGLRPDSITVKLMNSETKVAEQTLSATGDNGEWTEDDLTYTFTGQDKYDDNGALINYTVAEDEVANYGTEITGTAAAGYTITNTLDAGTTSVTVTKVWVDTADSHDEVVINILADGQDSGYDAVLNEANNWTATVNNLPLRASGTVIDYTVDEASVPNGYTSDVVEGENNTFTVYNVIDQDETVSISATKTWEGGDENHRPELTFTLWADGSATSQTIKSTDEGYDPNNITFSGLDKYAYTIVNGQKVSCKEIQYSIQETMDGDLADRYDSNCEIVEGVYQFTNTFDAGTATVNGIKTWVDGGKSTHSTVTVGVFETNASGEVLSEIPVKTAEITDSYSFTDLPAYNTDGSAKSYAVYEMDDGTRLAAGQEITIGEDTYVVSYQTATITNTLKQETVSVPVNKVWQGPAAESVTFNLLRNDSKIDELTLTADDAGEDGTWSGAFENLDKYDSNRDEYRYTVEEVPVTGYISRQTGGNTFINTVEQTTTSLTVVKEWIMPEDDSVELPASVKIQLYAGGSVYTEEPAEGAIDYTKPVEITAGEDGTWTYTFENLPKYAYTYDEDNNVSSVREIQYTVSEVGATLSGEDYVVQIGHDHYEVTYAANESGQWVISNDYIRTDVFGYRVIRNYFTITDGVRSTDGVEGQLDPTLGEQGENVSVDPASYTQYNDQNYTFKSGMIDGIGTEKFQFALDETNHIYYVVLNYERTVTTPTPPTHGSTYYTVTVNYYDKDTGEKIAASHSESIRSGNSYDVTAYDAITIEGYTYVETTGDALTGTMNSDKVINVYYTADGTDIDDPDVPQGELPDDPGTDIDDPDVPQGELPTDLPDEDVPMADAPATGDTLMAWIAAAAVSGVGLVWLSIMGKKRKDENEG